jgi:hypothetical protein
MNILPLLQVWFYGNPNERIFWNITSMFNGIIGMMLGVLAHLMFRSSKDAFPRTIDDIDTRHKKNARKIK